LVEEGVGVGDVILVGVARLRDVAHNVVLGDNGFAVFNSSRALIEFDAFSISNIN
jgi:hypothetical protein